MPALHQYLLVSMMSQLRGSKTLPVWLNQFTKRQCPGSLSPDVHLSPCQTSEHRKYLLHLHPKCFDTFTEGFTWPFPCWMHPPLPPCSVSNWIFYTLSLNVLHISHTTEDMRWPQVTVGQQHPIDNSVSKRDPSPAVSQHVTCVTKQLWGCFWVKQLCQAAVSVTLQAVLSCFLGTGMHRGPCVLHAKTAVPWTWESCGVLVSGRFGGPFSLSQWRSAYRAALWTSVDSELLPHYTGSTAILWQLLLHVALFLWTAQAKLQKNKEGTILSPTHQFNFS